MLKTEIKLYALYKLKQKIIINIIFIILVSISVYIKINNYYTHENLSESTRTLIKQLANLNLEVNKTQSDVTLWNEKLKKIYQQRQGLNLDIAKRKIEQLRLKHNISNISVSLTNPESRQDILKLQYTDIFYSQVVMSFEAYTDKDILRFINDLKEQLPGVITFVAFTMNGISQINRDLLVVGEESSVKIKNTINVKLELLWQNLMDKK